MENKTLEQIQQEMKTAIFVVIDSRTNQIMGEYKGRTRARNKADKLDNAFGAYRYRYELKK